MKAARVHGPKDMRMEELDDPPAPSAGEVSLRVEAVGICGSDLHTYLDAAIGDTLLRSPLILGHEFSGVVERCGPLAVDGGGQPLQPGTRVAVDPAQPCGSCELCRRGHPNLCPNLRFCGLHPHHGSLCQRMIVPSYSCFPLPPAMDFATGALLEPLGVALHAVDLARLSLGHTVSVHGAGPIGLLILQASRLAGAATVYVVDPLPWRRTLAGRLGGIPLDPAEGDPGPRIQEATQGRGVDAAIESAWGGDATRQSVEAVRHGGRVVVVGIPSDDQLLVPHSTARRKGLTILLSRRMKHSYPRAIQLASRGTVDVGSLITHHFPLDRTPEVFALNAAYRDGVVKAIIDVGGP
jgi:L-iditol 2-dehydrogenase